MTERVAPKPLAAPTPRAVHINGLYLGLYLFMAGVIGTFLLLWFVIADNSHRKTSALVQRGVTITATITSIQLTKAGTHLVRYRFDPPQLARSPVKFEEGESIDDDQDLEVGGPISVIYDPQRPDRSMSSTALTRVEQSGVWPQFALVSALFGLPLLSTGVLMIIYYRRQKWILQWGKCAPATIIDQREHRTRYGRSVKVTYTFEDDHGVLRSGKFRALPTEDDPDFQSREILDRYLESPFAVYDPRNSRRNVLYPATIARLL